MSGPKSDSIDLTGVAVGAAILAAGAVVGAAVGTAYLVGGLFKEIAGMAGDIGSGIASINAKQAELYQEMIESYRKSILEAENALNLIRRKMPAIKAMSKSCDGLDLSHYTSACDSIIKQLEELRDTDISSDATMIGQAANRIEEITKSLLEEYQKLEKEQEEAVAEYRKRAQATEKENKQYRSFRTAKGQELYTSFTLAVEEIEGDISVSEETKNELVAVMEEASDLLGTFGLTVNDIKRLYGLKDEFLKAMQSDEAGAQRTIKYYRSIREEIDQHTQEYERLYGEYLLYYVAFIEALNNDIAPEDVKYDFVPKDRGFFPNAEAIEEEIDDLKKITIRRVCASYTAKTITEVMRDFGYDTERDIVLIEDENIEDKVFSSGDGTGAVHVRISREEGGEQTIMMETVKIESGEKTDDRKTTATAVRHTRLSEEEIEEGYEAQVQFCKMHPRIVEELAKRGILFKNEIAHCRPDRKYSKKIIVYDASGLTSSELEAEQTKISGTSIRRRNAAKKAKAAAKKI